MPMIQLDPETKKPVTYYTTDEVEKLVDEIVEEANEWAGEDVRVVANRILFEHGLEVKDADTAP